MKKIIYSLIVISLAISCTKELPYPDVDNADFIVLNGLVNPTSGVKVHLSQSCHITDVDCNQKSLTNGQVLLKDAAGSILTELEHKGEGIYNAEDFVILENTTYHIEASSANLPTIKSQTSSPKSFTCDLVEFEEEIYQDNLCRTFTIDIQDNPDETNYYLVNGFVDILNGEHDDGTTNELNGFIQPHTGFFTQNVNAENNVMVSSVDIIPYALDFVFLKDENFNGELYQLKFGLFDLDINFDKDYELEATISIKSVSKELYDYYRSVTMFKLTAANILAEPEQILSNIEDGVGIFGSYTEQVFVVDLPKTEFWYEGDMDIQNDGCTAPCEVQFSAEMGDGIIPHWDFGDGTTSTERNPIHTYQQAGEFNVVLSVAIGEDHRSSESGILIN